MKKILKEPMFKFCLILAQFYCSYLKKSIALKRIGLFETDLTINLQIDMKKQDIKNEEKFSGFTNTDKENINEPCKKNSETEHKNLAKKMLVKKTNTMFSPKSALSSQSESSSEESQSSNETENSDNFQKNPTEMIKKGFKRHTNVVITRSKQKKIDEIKKESPKESILLNNIDKIVLEEASFFTLKNFEESFITFFDEINNKLNYDVSASDIDSIKNKLTNLKKYFINFYSTLAQSKKENKQFMEKHSSIFKYFDLIYSLLKNIYENDKVNQTLIPKINTSLKRLAFVIFQFKNLLEGQNYNKYDDESDNTLNSFRNKRKLSMEKEMEFLHPKKRFKMNQEKNVYQVDN